MKYFNLLLAVYLLLGGCSQEPVDQQTEAADKKTTTSIP